jgi:hypothetical protein
MKFYYLLLLFVITACGSGTESTTEENGQNTQNETSETVSDVNEPITEVEIGEGDTDTDASDPDSLVVPSFSIHFDFSKDVQDLLDSGKEGLIIDLVLSGMPLDKTKLMDKDYYSDEDEEVYLKNLEIVYEQNEAKTLTIENLKISKEALNALEDPNYTIGVNFYSSRTSSDNNIFAASVLIEDLDVMKGKTHTVKVKML